MKTETEVTQEKITELQNQVSVLKNTIRRLELDLERTEGRANALQGVVNGALDRMSSQVREVIRILK